MKLYILLFYVREDSCYNFICQTKLIFVFLFCSTLGLITDVVCLKHGGLITSKMLPFSSVLGKDRVGRAGLITWQKRLKNFKFLFCNVRYTAKIQCKVSIYVLKRTVYK